MVMEPEKKHSDSPQQGPVRDEEGGSMELSHDQTVMEIPDSTSNRDAQASSSPGKTDERSFIASLNCFMKDRGTPIERIPHLGFKQINLWRIYKAVEKLGGYDSVTARRLWKSVYDELGGSPGSTSAATCTRRHYERLVLPFERERRGEEDKPLPQSKPRKQYKRGPDGKGCKSDGKRKSAHLDKDTDSQAVSQVQNRPESTQCQTGAYGPSSPWTIPSDRLLAGCSQPNKDGDEHSHTLYTPPQLVSAPAAFSWSSHGPSTPGEVISPLEKKKRVAQASLGLSPGCREEEAKDRPSVIHCSQSPGLQPGVHSCNSSEGSPLPRSSCSSRCSSPYSVSSEDGAARPGDKPSQLRPESPHVYPADHLLASGPGGAPTPQSGGFGGKDVPDSSSPRRNAPLTAPLPAVAVPIKSQSRPPVWSPVRNMTSGLPAPYMVLPTPSAYAVVKLPSASASGFTKVPHKSLEPLRPIPFQPGYRHLQNPNRSMQHDDTLTYAKRIHVAHPLYAAERKEKSRTMLPKPQPTQHPVFHPTSGIPVSYLIPAYDRAARDIRHPQGFHPVFLPGNMRLPQTQPGPVYHRHVVTGAPQSAPYDPVHCYPYPSPVWNIQTGYSHHGANAHYSHTRL